MSFPGINNRDNICNDRGSTGSKNRNEGNNSSDTSTSAKNVFHKHSTTNTSSDVSYGPSNCVSIPMELVVVPPFSKELTDNLNCYFEGDCKNNLCKNRQWPFLHMDTISKIRLKSLVKSIYDDKRNSSLFKPPSCPYEEDAATSACCLQPQRKRKKCKKKKGCCKKNPSVVSLHFNWPQFASSKKSCCCKKKKKRRARSPERVACPYYAAKLAQNICPPQDLEAKAISLKLGNQKIVISFEDNPDCSAKKDSPCLVKSIESNDEESEEQSCPFLRPHIRQRPQNDKTHWSSSSPKRVQNTPKTCECLEKLKANIAKNLIKLISNKLANCNECCKSKKIQSKVNTCTCTSSRMFSFEVDLDEDEFRNCLRRPPSFSRPKKRSSCCCKKKKKTGQNIVVSVNSNSTDGCCCKNCANDKRKRYSSSGPPIEYVYVQEERTGPCNPIALANSGSSSMNSRNVDDNSNVATSRRENNYQYRSRQGVFLQNEMTLASQSSKLPVRLSCEKIGQPYKAVPAATINSNFVPFNTKSEGTSISQNSELNFNNINFNKQKIECPTGNDKYNFFTSDLLKDLKRNYEIEGNIRKNKNHSFYDEEEVIENRDRYGCKYTPKTPRVLENLQDSVNKLQCSVRNRDHECDELEKLMLEIESYWQTNSSNWNIFENQGKHIIDSKSEVDDGFVESINEDSDDPDAWKIAITDKMSEFFGKNSNFPTNTRLLTNRNKFEHSSPKKNVRGTSKRCSEKERIASLEIYSSLKLFKEHLFEKLHEQELLKFREGTNLYLGDVPLKLNFDTKSASTNCCGEYGNSRINEEDKMSAKYLGNDNRGIICNVHPYDIYAEKGNSHTTSEDQGTNAMNLFPVLCENTYQSSRNTISQHENLSYICCYMDQSNIKPANNLNLINLETQSNFMIEIENEFLAENVWKNETFQHVNSTMTSNECFSETFTTNWMQYPSRTDIDEISHGSLIYLDNSLSLQTSPHSSTLCLKVDCPYSFLVYSLFNQQEMMMKSPESLLEHEDKSKRKLTKFKCSENKTPCSFSPQNYTTNITNIFHFSESDRTRGCLNPNSVVSSDDTMIPQIPKIHSLRDEVVNEKNEFLNETATCPIKIDMESMNNQEKQLLMRYENAVAKKAQRNYECAQTSKSKRKCGCSRSYKMSSPQTVSSPRRAAKTKLFSCVGKHLEKLLEILDSKTNTKACQERINSKQASCRIKDATPKDIHFCDLCKLFSGIGDIMDEKKSIISLKFSDADKLISLLDDMKYTRSEIFTSIKRLKETGRNSEPNDFDEYIPTCITERSDLPSKIAITIKYSDSETNSKNMSLSDCMKWQSSNHKIGEQRMYPSDDDIYQDNSESCICLGENHRRIDRKRDIECIFKRHETCIVPTIYETSHNETGNNEKQEIDLKKSKAVKECRLAGERRFSLPGQVMPFIEVEFQNDVNMKDKVECIFKNERTCSLSENKRMPVTTNETCIVKKPEEQVRRKSCHKENCPRLAEPLIFPENALNECLVEGRCTREKVLRTICVIPEVPQKQEVEIEPLKPTIQKKALFKIGDKKLQKTTTKKKGKLAPKKIPSKNKSKKRPTSGGKKNPPSKKNSKQKTSVSNTKVPVQKTKSKQSKSASETKVPARKKNTKQSKSANDIKAPSQKATSKKSKSTSDTKVPARKSNSKQSKASSDTKVPSKKNSRTPARKSNSKKSLGAKTPVRKTNSKSKSSVKTNKKSPKKPIPVKTPTKQTKPIKETVVLKEPEKITPEEPLLVLNEEDMSMLSRALDDFLTKMGFQLFQFWNF